MELNDELELTVELKLLLSGLDRSPQMLLGAGSKEGDDPMDEPRDPKPSSTPYKFPRPEPTSLPMPLVELLKEEKSELSS